MPSSHIVGSLKPLGLVLGFGLMASGPLRAGLRRPRAAWSPSPMRVFDAPAIRRAFSRLASRL